MTKAQQEMLNAFTKEFDKYAYGDVWCESFEEAIKSLLLTWSDKVRDEMREEVKEMIKEMIKEMKKDMIKSGDPVKMLVEGLLDGGYN